MLVVKVIIIASPEKKYIVPTTIFRKLISEHSFFLLVEGNIIKTSPTKAVLSC